MIHTTQKRSALAHLGRSFAHGVLALAALAGFASCERRAALEPRPTGPAGVASASGTPLPTAGGRHREVVAHMREHFLRVLAVRDAVIAGDLAAAREPARWLAEHGAPRDVPDPWIPYITDLRVLSAGLVEAESVGELARSVGVVAGTCQACHDGLSVRIEYLPGLPPRAQDPRGRMHRHEWAMERLWNGLVMPNELAWERGAEALIESPFAPSFFLGDIETRTELAARSQQLQQLGQRAAEADKLDRGRLYGELLTTCARCHQLAGVQVGRSLEPALESMPITE